MPISRYELITSLNDKEIGFEILNMDSCFKVILNKSHKSRITNKPFQLAGGDILEVGDKFTAINTKGSAGCPPIVLSKPWYQQYEGRIRIPNYTSYGRHLLCNGQQHSELALFSAHNPITNEKMFSPTKKNIQQSYKDTDDGYYIGYLIFGKEEDQLFYCCKSGSSRVISCKTLKRY
ncbi:MULTISPECIES: hypothetical protein [Photobacterium]|uniref:Uncharacterized protein n=1 Tax=Photobacterium carnosum TaxID=2023717 RepID=A0A2N4UPR5_9GAMM|nr:MULTISPECIES: hypothetical protein [Photobacterium]MBY3788988.1 hypothetical protein [Photobacterium carnosum]MCD9463352.1 hypothetical protein [Photobacterium phosphoreum]MCD9480135.1 hypothetical protein [Photobacterium phosphoreum]MCD9502258.1 hypothetical protein [Photobacterium phosphoreum]MCD9512481.1 hypothetical protein [Photobacterium phosphoreum]